MNEYKKQFGHELRNRLLSKDSQEKLFSWLQDEYDNFEYDKDPELGDILASLIMMNKGPEHKINFNELLDIANKLIES
jgi:hypothetical protein